MKIEKIEHHLLTFGSNDCQVCDLFKIGAMHKCGDLENEKRCKINIFLQRPASMQPRTDSPKDLRVDRNRPLCITRRFTRNTSNKQITRNPK